MDVEWWDDDVVEYVLGLSGGCDCVGGDVSVVGDCEYCGFCE